jgi:hypothetical protein
VEAIPFPANRFGYNKIANLQDHSTLLAPLLKQRIIMKYLARILWVSLAFVLLTLAACGEGTSVTSTADPNLVYTQIWVTVEVGQTQTALAVPPTPINTSTPKVSSTPKSTNTPLISETPLPGTPSVTPLVVRTLQSTSQQACDNASFGGDVTYADGSVVPAGQPFVKTWNIKNLGPCTWNQDYLLIFGWGGTGTNWSTVQPVHFSQVFLPGESMEISVTLTAPTTPGDYAATFRTQNDNGFNFGPSLTVLIKVK